MRVSELAKELGYKAAELVELAKHKNISIADARVDLNARVTAAVRAAVPHRSKLAGTPLMEVYARVVADETARAAPKAPEPKPEKPPPKLNKRVTKKEEEVPPVAAAPPSACREEDPEAREGAAQEAKVVEFRLGATDAKGGQAGDTNRADGSRRRSEGRRHR
jgi:hypothetical protein